MSIKMTQRTVGTIVLAIIVCAFLSLFWHAMRKQPSQDLVEMEFPPPPERPFVDNATSPEILDSAEAAKSDPELASGIEEATSQVDTAPFQLVSREDLETAAESTQTTETTLQTKTESATQAVSTVQETQIATTQPLFVSPSQPAEAEPIKTTRVSKKSRANGHAWTIQVASFADERLAQHLTSQLKEKGYHSYLHQAKTQQGQRVRVYVGPLLNHHQAKQKLAKLNRQYHTKGMIVRYDATQR